MCQFSIRTVFSFQVLFKINCVYNKTLKFIYGMLALKTNC